MSDKIVVQELKAAAEDALSRGFAILTCEPHDKSPWAKYSPHAVNSSTRVPELALLAWTEGHEANYGVGCGPSNLTVVDCDHGLASVEEFEAWRVEHNLPETLTVVSGREGFGAHMYYSGAVPTCGFKIGNVTGELKGLGGYVVGPGSIHPDTGKKYYILKDIDVAPLPEGVANFAKEKTKNKLDFTPKSEGGELIPAGSRWIHLQSTAGKLRNAGLDETGIYTALKNFCEVNCEDGANYPEEKIKALASAAVTKFDATESTPVVFFGNSDKKIQTGISELPIKAVDGDWLGDLSHLVADGTFIPLAFARSQIKTILGASLNGLVGFPNQTDLHMKHWSVLVSSHPESGKGESWKRTAEAALKIYIDKTSLGLPKAGYFSSGEHMVKYLANPDNNYEGKNVIVYFDEMKTLFEKGGSQNSTLFSKLIELYDRNDSSAGSLSHEGGEFKNVAISLTGGFTRASFDRATAGKGAGGDGFLSRCVISYAGDVKHIGDWDEQDTGKINALAAKMLERYKGIYTEWSQENNKPVKDGEEKKEWRWVPVETDEAKKLREDFQKSLGAKRVELNEKYPDKGLVSRLESHFKRDLLLRTVFSDDMTITADKVARAIAWAEHELYLREEIWPIDDGNLIERMEQAMRRSLGRHEHLTQAKLQDACNVHRAGSGGMDTFNRAWAAMLKGNAIVKVGKTHKGTEVFGLRDG